MSKLNLNIYLVKIKKHPDVINAHRDAFFLVTRTGFEPVLPP